MKKERYRRKTTFEKEKKHRVWPGCCTSWSFNKPGPVQPPSLGSTRRAGPDLITMILAMHIEVKMKLKFTSVQF
jgi:hypothetical protein